MNKRKSNANEIDYHSNGVQLNFSKIANSSNDYWLSISVPDRMQTAGTVVSKSIAGITEDEKIDFLMKACLIVQHWCLIGNPKDNAGFEALSRKIGVFGVRDEKLDHDFQFSGSFNLQ